MVKPSAGNAREVLGGAISANSALARREMFDQCWFDVPDHTSRRRVEGLQRMKHTRVGTAAKDQWLLIGLLGIVAATCGGGEPQTEPPPSAAPHSVADSAKRYEGTHDAATCAEVKGWAWDQTQPDRRVEIEIYEGGTVVARATADQYRPDLDKAGKGDGRHSFVYRFAHPLEDGRSHTFGVRVSGDKVNLALTPKSVTCDATGVVTESVGNGALYEGSLDAVTCEAIKGWAWRKDRPNEPVDVDVLAEQRVIATVSANVPRDDLKAAGKSDGAHAFSVAPPPSLRDGKQHQIRIRITSTDIELAGTDHALTCR